MGATSRVENLHGTMRGMRKRTRSHFHSGGKARERERVVRVKQEVMMKMKISHLNQGKQKVGRERRTKAKSIREQRGAKEAREALLAKVVREAECRVVEENSHHGAIAGVTGATMVVTQIGAIHGGAVVVVVAVVVNGTERDRAKKEVEASSW